MKRLLEVPGRFFRSGVAEPMALSDNDAIDLALILLKFANTPIADRIARGPTATRPADES
jgi:hypothetical protein